MRPQTFKFLNKYGISQITFSEKSGTPKFFKKVSFNLILHILVYKSTIFRKKNLYIINRKLLVPDSI
jgi:hypothetical protein